MIVSYDSVGNFSGWDKAQEYFASLLVGHNCRRVLEVGSGANPTLPPAFVQEAGLSYITSDLNPGELEKADAVFGKLVLDMSAETISPALIGSFDCILSRMVGEHISDGYRYHQNIFRMLRPGGISAHCFSTLWAFPFIANRLLPESVGSILQNRLGPRDQYRSGKFKAYYSWSRGPSKAMIKRFEELGFEVLQYTGYFGHRYYEHRLSWLHNIEMLKSKVLLRHPIPQLCSYASLVLRKPC